MGNPSLNGSSNIYLIKPSLQKIIFASKIFSAYSSSEYQRHKTMAVSFLALAYLPYKKMKGKAFP